MIATPWDIKHCGPGWLELMCPGDPDNLAEFKTPYYSMYPGCKDPKYTSDMVIDLGLFFDALNKELAHVHKMVRLLRVSKTGRFCKTVQKGARSLTTSISTSPHQSLPGTMNGSSATLLPTMIAFRGCIWTSSFHLASP